MDGKSGDMKDLNPATSLRGDGLRVPLDLLITRMTYFGQSKIRFFSKQQRIEKQIDGSSAG